MRHHWNSVSVWGVQGRGAQRGTRTPLSLALTEKTETEHIDKRLPYVSKIFETVQRVTKRTKIAAVVSESDGRWKHLRTAHRYHLLVHCETKLSPTGIVVSDRHAPHLIAHTHRLLLNGGTKWNPGARGLNGCFYFGLFATNT
jgi:hypothetical protein